MDEHSDSFFYRLAFFLGVILIGGGLFALLIQMISTNSVSASTLTPDPSSQTSSQNSAITYNPTAAITTDIKHATYSTGHTISHGAFATTRAVGSGTVTTLQATGHAAISTLAFTGHIFGDVVFAPVRGITHISTIIHPADHVVPPKITQLRAQQAALIQSGTQVVSVSAIASGAGGACDSGDGNGGYPMAWCSPRMDSVPTIPYSSDPINRECTSYAYWYFASVEGHSNLRVHGNAKYWAGSSNYPVHQAPAVGAIAVETRGTYGHVAIVQAMPGQAYAGQIVPAGYILVSEMNYDWNGHFRYSYSPLGKFSAFIYP